MDDTQYERDMDAHTAAKSGTGEIDRVRAMTPQQREAYRLDCAKRHGEEARAWCLRCRNDAVETKLTL